jgi:hypothetical protein
MPRVSLGVSVSRESQERDGVFSQQAMRAKSHICLVASTTSGLAGGRSQMVLWSGLCLQERRKVLVPLGTYFREWLYDCTIRESMMIEQMGEVFRCRPSYSVLGESSCYGGQASSCLSVKPTVEP